MTARRQRRALVVGGGVGGLAAAIALRRADCDVIVFERAEDLRAIQIGAGLHLWSNAMRALAHLDVDDAIRAVSSETEHFLYCDDKGSLVADWPVGRGAARLGAPTVGIARRDLHEVLLDAVGDGVLRLGSPCAGFEQDADGVTVQLADGTEERGDVLVGADGVRSVVRAGILGDSAPLYAGYTSWRWVFPEPRPQAPPGVFRMMMGPGKLFIVYRVGGGRAYCLGISREPEGGRDERGARASLAERYGGWAEPAPTLIADAGDDEITRADLYDRDPDERWSEGRTTLLGDAAHPMTPHAGQGAGMALEDAVVLAARLRESDDVPAALRAYKADRMPRTRRFQSNSRLFGKLNSAESSAARALRNTMMRLLFRGAFFRLAERDLTFTP